MTIEEELVSLREEKTVDWAAVGHNSVGDSITVCSSAGRAFPIFAVASIPGSAHLDEAMYTMAGGLAIDAK